MKKSFTKIKLLIVTLRSRRDQPQNVRFWTIITNFYRGIDFPRWGLIKQDSSRGSPTAILKVAYGMVWSALRR